MIKINNVTIPNPKTMVWGQYDLSSEATSRNLLGEMLKDIVATKVRVDLEWDPLTPAQASAILTAITAGVYMNVTYPDPKAGAEITKVMYVGDRESSALKYSNINGMEYWTGIKFGLIEK